MKYEIEIDCVPGGYVPVAFRRPLYGELFCINGTVERVSGVMSTSNVLIVELEKTMPLQKQEPQDKYIPKAGDYFCVDYGNNTESSLLFYCIQSDADFMIVLSKAVKEGKNRKRYVFDCRKYTFIKPGCDSLLKK